MKLEEIPGIQPDEVVLIRRIANLFKAQKITVCETWEVENERVRKGRFSSSSR